MMIEKISNSGFVQEEEEGGGGGKDDEPMNDGDVYAKMDTNDGSNIMNATKKQIRISNTTTYKKETEQLVECYHRESDAEEDGYTTTTIHIHIL